MMFMVRATYGVAGMAALLIVSAYIYQAGAQTEAGSSKRLTGPKVIALLQAGKANQVFAQFSPQMARAVPLATLQQVWDSTNKEAPVGNKITDQTETSNGQTVYYAEHEWKPNQPISITAVFGADGQINGLLLRPVKSLPPDPHAGYVPKNTLRLPFAPGESWYVVWGGKTERQNYHVVAPDQRHAFDMVALVSGSQKSYTGDGTRNEQYAAWGRTIVAPADATVLEAENTLPDNKPKRETDAKNAAGNHVILDLGQGEYAMLAHFQKGSVTVKAGDKIKAGQPLGKCGNSGNTSEPHLHFHVQDGPTLFRAKGLPVRFTNYAANGKTIASGSPVRGDVIVAK